MNEPDEVARLRAGLAQRLSLDSDFTGYALEAYRQVKQMSREQLATWLGVELAGLDRLAVCRRESTLNTDYPERVIALAVQFGLDPKRLDMVYRALIEFPAPSEADAVRMLKEIKRCADSGAVEVGNTPVAVAGDALRQLNKVVIAGYLDNARILALAGLTVADVRDMRAQLESIEAVGRDH